MLKQMSNCQCLDHDKAAWGPKILALINAITSLKQCWDKVMWVIEKQKTKKLQDQFVISMSWSSCGATLSKPFDPGNNWPISSVAWNCVSSFELPWLGRSNWLQDLGAWQTPAPGLDDEFLFRYRSNTHWLLQLRKNSWDNADPPPTVFGREHGTIRRSLAWGTNIQQTMPKACHFLAKTPSPLSGIQCDYSSQAKNL